MICRASGAEVRASEIPFFLGEEMEKKKKALITADKYTFSSCEEKKRHKRLFVLLDAREVQASRVAPMKRQCCTHDYSKQYPA